MNCLQGFTQELSRDQHQAYCEDNESVRVEMPKQGSTWTESIWSSIYNVRRF